MSAGGNEVDQRVGSRVRAAREAVGLSQTTVGASLNLTYQQVQKYERGLNRLSVSSLQRIAECLGVPASAFLDPEHRTPPSAPEQSGLDKPAVDALVSALNSLTEILTKDKDRSAAPPATQSDWTTARRGAPGSSVISTSAGRFQSRRK